MYLLGYNLDNLSLMALTISTGFVVDDAIVVIENITRYLEQGMAPFRRGAQGCARGWGSTVFTISVSLVAVFIPLLLMGGIVGRLFREFADRRSTGGFASASRWLFRLTATPMMCAYLLKGQPIPRLGLPQNRRAGFRLDRADVQRHACDRAALTCFVTLAVLLATIGLNVYLFMQVSKGFFPQQDNGRMQGSVQGDQATSFEAMDAALQQDHHDHRRRSGDRLREWLHRRRHVEHGSPLHRVEAARGAEGLGGCRRGQAAAEAGPGAGRHLVPATRAGPASRRPPEQRAVSIHDAGRQPRGPHDAYAPQMVAKLRSIPILTDVNSDQQNNGLQTLIHYDRSTASRFGISPQLIDATLYDAFGQRQVSTMSHGIRSISYPLCR